MKKITILSAALLGGFLSYAQDTYWPLADNKIYNTATGSVFTTPQVLSPYGGFGFDGDPQVVFNANAHVLFTGGPYSPNFKMSNMGQVIFPVPNDCKRYVTVRAVGTTTPHGHLVDVKKIDATAVTNDINTTGLPQYISFSAPGFNPNLFSGADATDYSIAASRLNADGTRYFYHINKPASSSTATLYQYTVNAQGELVNPTSPTVITTSLPPGVYLHMSHDGQSLGYIRSSDGKFVTYQLYGSYTVHNTFAVNLAGGYTPGIEQVTVGSDRVWVIGDNDQAGYVIEGNASYTSIENGGLGTNTSFALGRDGMMYFAYADGGPEGGDGALRKFAPTSMLSTFNLSLSTIVSGAYIRATNWNGTSFLFGNHVSGEDINSATAPIYAPTFTLNGLTSTPSTAIDIILCSGQDIQLILNGYIPGITANSVISVALGELFDDEFVIGEDLGFIEGNWYGAVSVDLIDYFDVLRDYSGQFRVRFDTYSPCGNLLSSIDQVFNIIQANASVEFFLIGPSSLGTPACPSPNGLSTHNGLQPRVTSVAALNANRPAGQPLASPVCSLGWVGKFTCGVHQGYVSKQNVSLTGYTLIVDEYDNTGTGSYTNIINNYAASMPAQGYQFNQMGGGMYFYNNYLTIRDNNVYKVTLKVTTPECGEYSNYAYFKILDGDEPGPLWREGDPNALETVSLEKIYMYPNPATDRVHVAWNSNAKEDGLAQISVTDVMGRVVLQKNLPQSFGTNDVPLDISQLTAGVYHYVLKTSNESSKGSLVKQ